MKRIALIALCLALGAPVAHAGAAPAVPGPDPVLFAGAGTNLTNGVFFPGTGLYDGSKYFTVQPLQVPKGRNVDFVNLDASVVTNYHQIRSRKLVLRGRRRVPLFQSPAVNGPGTATLITCHVKPGVYEYICTIHGGMVGFFEVLKS